MRLNKRFLAGLAALGFMSDLVDSHAAPLNVGQPFPPLSFPDLDGVPKSIADFQGHKTILHIFASW